MLEAVEVPDVEATPAVPDRLPLDVAVDAVDAVVDIVDMVEATDAVDAVEAVEPVEAVDAVEAVEDVDDMDEPEVEEEDPPPETGEVLLRVNWLDCARMALDVVDMRLI